MRKKIVLLFLISSGIFNFQNNLIAQDYEKTCFLLEGSYGTVLGGFNGKDILTGNGNVFLLPELESGYGFGLSVGRNSTEHYYGLKYGRLQYDATFDTKSLGKSIHSIIGIEGKLFYPRSRKDKNPEKKPVAQFFISGGCEFGFLKVKDGFQNVSFNILGDPIFVSGDARFNWCGFPFGVGFSVNPFKELSINFGASYRLAKTIVAVEAGMDKERYEVSDWVGMSGPFYDVGLCVNF